jgi:hypothetical protein
MVFEYKWKMQGGVLYYGIYVGRDRAMTETHVSKATRVGIVQRAANYLILNLIQD